MLIRPRTPEDLEACVQALAEVHPVDRYPVDWPDDPAAWLTPGGLRRAWVVTEHRPAEHRPAEDQDAGGVVLGHVALTGDLQVTRLFVVPSARGRGVAGLLLEAARAAAGGRPLKLEVSSEGEAAISLYERAGWRRTGSSRATWLNAAGEPALLHHYVSPAPG
ncbi:GNAT family N-acetyltransferase [Actinomadura sp. ATCC 31491]|uniref:GNAT family N-acetyltransferase n=1 Tax=Actinomadura luzonensis TaxID=2805427 RepID=A0ABT0FTW2_9ACTN|nr:GNAT family N-acetyltransferase [Actinomadura luzonensis]MCK2215768.1 GNAT family N-acetyltransferase [Actinomadura luzonensis]